MCYKGELNQPQSKMILNHLQLSKPSTIRWVQNLQNFKSDNGTAYLKKGDSVTVADRDKFVKFVLDGHLEFLDARVLKDPVRDWTDKHEAPPPGVKIEPFVQCIIRK